MKLILVILFLSMWVEGKCQAVKYTTNEGYLLSTLERSIIIPEDTSGVAVIQVVKKDTLIYVRTIYSSIKDLAYFKAGFLKDRENRLPEEYTRLVPVYFYFDARDGQDEKAPAMKSIREADNSISHLKHEYRVTEPLKLTSYRVVH